MQTFLILAAFAAGLYALMQALTARRASVTRQLALARSGTTIVTTPTPARVRRRPARAELTTELARLGSRLQPGLDDASLRRRLHMAGVTIGARRFRAAKTALALAVACLAATSLLMGNGHALYAGPALAVAMFVLPDSVLTMRQRSRRREIERQLPDALDLLTVSVEAGLGFDGAVGKLVERLHGPLIEEFELMLHEMRLGSTRRHAMEQLAERTGSDDVRTFVRSLLQSDELGVAIGTALRIQADDLRTHRQLRAEERATKAPVKLLFPTVVFIFPTIFMVVVAPAMMNVLDMLAT